MRDTRLVRTCVDGDGHTLVLGTSSDGTARFDSLFDLLPDDGPTDVLAITYRRSERLLHRWRERADRRPRNVAVLSVGEQMRSAAEGGPTPVERTPLYGVADPADTEAIRRTATRYLDGWPDDGRTVVYFDSLTALRDHLDPADAVAFLAAFRAALDDRGAVGYFWMRPTAHDPSVVRRVVSQFDTVVERVETGADDEGRAELSVDDCLDALADARRRRLLAAIARGEDGDDGEAGPVSVGELVDRVAERTPADRRAVRVSLVNVHLPKLADLGVVAYDSDDGRVRPGVGFEAVLPFLRSAPDVEVPDADAAAEDR